jgi:hypothetical protein
MLIALSCPTPVLPETSAVGRPRHPRHRRTALSAEHPIWDVEVPAVMACFLLEEAGEH